jgi:dTDP-glucose 4,6-dehydratase
MNLDNQEAMVYGAAMRVIVTGGAGFIGSHFVRQWSSENPSDIVVIFDNLTCTIQANLAELVQLPNVIFEQGDIANPDDVRRICEGAGLIVNFAAQTHVDRSLRTPMNFVTTNVVGVGNLLEFAREHKVRLHHVSTDEVYGDLPLTGGERFTETSPMRPSSPYSATKAAGDMLVYAYFRSFGVQATISNTSNNYGPWQYPEKLIPVMAKRAVDGLSLPVYGTGENIRDWIHVSDHVRGIIAVIEKGNIGETYCFGGDAERSNLQIVHAICEHFGIDPSARIKYVADRPGHDLRYAIDSTKAERELGWYRLCRFDDGLRQTLAWYAKYADLLVLDEQGVHVNS